MALVSKPNRLFTETYPGATHLHRKWHSISNRYSTIPKGREPSPILARKATTRTVYQGPGGLPHNQVDAISTQVYNYGAWSNRFYATQTMSLNRAYERFKQAVGMRAELGTSLAERQQAVNMIVDRAIDLRVGYQYLRRGQFRRFLNHFGLRPRRREHRSAWSRPNEASRLWLEYHFGWSPLIQDIHTGIQLLEAPFSYDKPVKGTSTESVQWFREKFSTFEWYDGTFKARTKIQAKVTVTNPNLHRATQLGLTNPAAIAWELIPFSFLVDWFIPVGNFLNSWSDFFGLQFSGAFTTRYDDFQGSVSRYMQATPNASSVVSELSVAHHQRTLGIAKPVVYPKVFKGFSVTRGATAIALLVTAFKS